MRLLTNVVTTIRKRRAELKTEDTALQKALAALAGNPAPATRPGRKKMTKAQREAIGLRMRKYWRQRRAAEKGKG